MNERTRAAGVIVLEGDQVLLVEHKEKARNLTGKWGLPAGRINAREGVKDGAVRELREETGLIAPREALIDFRGEPVIGEGHELKDGVESFVFYVFLCVRYQGELRESEETRPAWVKVSDIAQLDLLTAPNVQELIREGIVFNQHELSKN